MANENNNLCKISEIKISANSHATEDIEKVKETIKKLIPEKMHKETDLHILSIMGHAGNPICMIDISVKKKKPIAEVLEHISSILDDSEKEYLTGELENRLGEDNRLYLRLDKQEAYKDNFTLDDKDNTIKLEIQFVIYKEEPNLIRNYLSKAGLIMSD